MGGVRCTDAPGRTSNRAINQLTHPSCLTRPPNLPQNTQRRRGGLPLRGAGGDRAGGAGGGRGATAHAGGQVLRHGGPRPARVSRASEASSASVCDGWGGCAVHKTSISASPTNQLISTRYHTQVVRRLRPQGAAGGAFLVL